MHFVFATPLLYSAKKRCVVAPGQNYLAFLDDPKTSQLQHPRVSTIKMLDVDEGLLKSWSCKDSDMFCRCTYKTFAKNRQEERRRVAI